MKYSSANLKNTAWPTVPRYYDDVSSSQCQCALSLSGIGGRSGSTVLHESSQKIFTINSIWLCNMVISSSAGSVLSVTASHWRGVLRKGILLPVPHSALVWMYLAMNIEISYQISDVRRPTDYSTESFLGIWEATCPVELDFQTIFIFYLWNTMYLHILIS